MEQLPNASYNEHREFAEGIIWNDYRTEINRWLTEIRNQLETGASLDELRMLQGNAEACRKFLLLPNVLMEQAQMRMEEERGRE